MPTQKVDILLPVFGEAPYLVETLNSIIPELNDLNAIIIIEDRPTEITRGVIRDFQSKFPHKVKAIISKSPGVANALNCGLEFSDAELIARIDSDDLVIAGRISKQRNELSKRNVLVLGGQALFIDESGNSRRPYKTNNPISMLEINRQMFFRNPVVHPAVMFRRDSALAAGGYQDEFEGLEDFDLWVRMSLLGKIRNSRDVYIRYRISGTQASRRIRNVKSRHCAILNQLPTQLVRKKLLFLETIQEIEELNSTATRENLGRFGIHCLQLFYISPVTSISYFRYRLSSHLKCKWQEQMKKG